MLLVFPHGALSYNAAQPADLVDLSINLAVLEVDEQGLKLESSMRFFNDDEARGLEQRVLALASWLEADVEKTLDYPGWQPDFDNPLLSLARDSYRDLLSQCLQRDPKKRPSAADLLNAVEVATGKREGQQGNPFDQMPSTLNEPVEEADNLYQEMTEAAAALLDTSEGWTPPES